LYIYILYRYMLSDLYTQLYSMRIVSKKKKTHNLTIYIKKNKNIFNTNDFKM